MIAVPVVFGFDVGTTCVKGLVLTAEGTVLGTASYEVPVARPAPDRAEVDPENWLRGMQSVVAEALTAAMCSPEDVRALAVVSMRDAIVCLDDGDDVVRPSILWTDQRTAPQLRALMSDITRERLYDICGTVPVVGLAGPVALWMQEHEPDLWRRVRKVRHVKDWLVWRLCGVDATDISTITRSLINDARTDSWSPELLAAAHIDAGLLTHDIRQPTEVIGHLGAAGAQMLGLAPDVVVVAGGGDDPAAALGAGAIEVDSVCAGTGTASDWRRVAAAYVPDPLGRRDCSPHFVFGRYIVAATIDGTGTSLRWFRDLFRRDAGPTEGGFIDDIDFAALTQQAATVAPGAESLLFLPFLEGNRAPHFLNGASGGFFGLRAGHTRAHLARAVLEGIGFLYPGTLRLLGGQIPPAISMIDGETRSGVWNQIKADILGIPIHVPRVSEAAAVGAAMVAGIGTGLFCDVTTAVQACVRPGVTYQPDPALHAIYSELQYIFDKTISGLTPAFAALEDTRQVSVL